MRLDEYDLYSGLVYSHDAEAWLRREDYECLYPDGCFTSGLFLPLSVYEGVLGSSFSEDQFNKILMEVDEDGDMEY